MTIEELIEAALKTKEGRPFVRMSQPSRLHSGVPTLAKGIYRPFSPQLKARFLRIGRWEFATHGDWLGLEDMERLWIPDADDDWTTRIRLSRLAAEKDWGNDAAALFRPDRLSLFAGNTGASNEQIYLLWLDWTEEPELWVYDSNGDLRFIDLFEYLSAYLANETHRYSRPWRLHQP